MILSLYHCAKGLFFGEFHRGYLQELVNSADETWKPGV